MIPQLITLVCTKENQHLNFPLPFLFLFPKLDFWQYPPYNSRLMSSDTHLLMTSFSNTPGKLASVFVDTPPSSQILFNDLIVIYMLCPVVSHLPGSRTNNRVLLIVYEFLFCPPFPSSLEFEMSSPSLFFKRVETTKHHLIMP